MERQSSSYESVCDQVLPLSSKYPWFVAENFGSEEDCSTNHTFYTTHDPLSKYQCQIPELRGRRIRGYYHGWVILSDHPQNVMWSLWNPVTSQMINLPPLVLKDSDSEPIKECCLSAPPDDPTSVLLLTRTNKPTFVFFRLVNKRKKLIRWMEMSYASQLEKIAGEDGLFIYRLACCNGKIYALKPPGFYGSFVLQLDIVVKEKEVLIKLLLLGIGPSPSFHHCREMTYFLKGSCTELFYIIVGYYEKRIEGVFLFKLDITSLKSEEMERFKNLDMTSSSMNWEDVEESEDLEYNEDWKNFFKSMHMWVELVNLKDAIFLVDLACDQLVYYRTAIASECGGNIHIRDRKGKKLYSYHVKDKTVSLSFMPSLVLPTSNVSIWESRFEDDHGKDKCTVDSKQIDDEIVVTSGTDYKVECNESRLFSLPFDNLEMIMGLCLGVEYMTFRATCKRCHLAAPLIQWSTESSLRRLKTYSLISPWLMVVDDKQDIITLTDPMLGDVYFMKNRHLSLSHQEISCSRFGWLLIFHSKFCCLVFFNPLTNDLRKLPQADHGRMIVCFSAPPTSPDCIVVGFPIMHKQLVLIYYVAREPSWRRVRIDREPYDAPVDGKAYYSRFPTFLGQNLYALGSEGELIGFKNLVGDFSSTSVEAKTAKAPLSCCRSPLKYYLMKCDQNLILVIVGKFGEGIEVFKRNDSKQDWEKIDTLGKHMIYICGTTCLCIEAKTPEMENKIYFPLVHTKSRKIVFYSLKTCMYHTFNENIHQHFEDFFGTTYHIFPHAWIEPSWS